MARPRKNGLDYFPIDCDILSDEKIIAVKVYCGAKGIAVTVALLCAIYRHGYYAPWNDSTALKIANDLPGVSPEAVGKVVEILVKYDFFDKGLFCSENILTSAAIQRRFLSGKKHRVDPAALPFWLVLDSKTPILEAKTPILDSETPTKSKVNKISTPKVVDTKAAAHPPDRSVEDEVQELALDSFWLDQLQVATATPKEQLLPLLRDFAVHCRSIGQDSHTDMQHCKRHFRYWLNRLKNSTPDYVKPQNNQLRDPKGNKGPARRRRPSDPGYGLRDG